MDTEKLKDSAESVNDDTYGKKILNKSNGYVNGAIAGAVIGVFCAVIFKGKYIMFAGIGTLAGGYIGYKIAEEKNKEIKFTNFSI